MTISSFNPHSPVQRAYQSYLRELWDLEVRSAVSCGFLTEAEAAEWEGCGFDMRRAYNEYARRENECNEAFVG